MKIFFITIVLIFITSILVAQDTTIVQSFPFGNPFVFSNNWDRVEGPRPGVQSFMFVPDNLSLMLDPVSKNWLFIDMDDSFKIVRVYEKQNWNIFSKVFGFKYIFGSTDAESNIYIFNIENPNFTPEYVINIYGDEDLNPQSIPYLSGNFLFAETQSGNLISWELLPDRTTKYRGIKETKTWLDAGNTIEYGYHVGPDGLKYFGDFAMEYQAPALEKIWKNLTTADGASSSVRGFEYIGTDSRGLSNFYQYDFSKLYTTEPFQVTLAILDTWTRTVTFRKLPMGAWNPPRNEYGLLGMYPWAVHPSGDIYFFDADVEKKEYQLKRIQNDWWAELGVVKRIVGRVTTNYIPLKDSPSSSAFDNGYNYENEFVWILEESDKTETVDGKTSAWVKVRKIDGREGWMLKLYIDLNAY